VNGVMAEYRQYKKKLLPMVKRGLVILVLLPIGLYTIHQGGAVYASLMLLILGLAAWEFGNLYRAGGLQPARILILVGTLLLVGMRYLFNFEYSDAMLSLLILVSTAYHLLTYERGRDQAASDFTVTITGILYLGWIGSYMVSLRQLPEGKWWLLTVLVAVWLADTFAYLVGSRFGRHKITPRLSPKKSWEGYIAGIVVSLIGTPLFTLLWPASAGITMLDALWIALPLSTLTILGDLGESMIKRQFGVKDSGNLLPGHGGAFDRIDSWVWAAVIGYYLITLFLK
jgi:phosphatidate cytidylyltransferase